MDPAEAAMRVLEEGAPEALHWTVVWDRALRLGYIDPLTQRGARDELVRALAAGAREGRLEKVTTGTYRHRPGAGDLP